MNITSTKTLGLRKSAKTSIKIPVDSFRSQSLPNMNGAKLGSAFVRVTDIPIDFENYLRVNPRNPNRDDKNALTGNVVKGIFETLYENPVDMAIKNQGIYLLVEDVKTYKEAGSQEYMEVVLSDARVHGVVNGGHTYAAIIDAVETADSEKLKSLSTAYVRIHVMSQVDREKVVEMAEGLNRSKQVDDPSIAELKGEFNAIKEIMRGEKGAEQIFFHQGGDGEFYISQVLCLLEMFNLQRFPEEKFPTALYNSRRYGLKYFAEDVKANPGMVKVLTTMLPDILKLHDLVKKQILTTASGRAVSVRRKNIRLHFIDEDVDYAVPNGWAYPIISAFRANVELDVAKVKFNWRIPIEELVPKAIETLVGTCSLEKSAPDKVGKSPLVYKSCLQDLEKIISKLS